MNTEKQELRQRTKTFASGIIRFYCSLPRTLSKNVKRRLDGEE